MLLKWIISAFLVTSYTEAIMLRSTLGNYAVCGEHVTIVCTANHTTFITISINGYGSHTFERNSKKLAQLGLLNLNLTKADIDPDNPYLTAFEVVGITNQQYAVDLPQILCSDFITSTFLQVEIKSELCTQNTLVFKKSSNGIMLQWEHPTCPGWKDLIHQYQINITMMEGVVFQNLSNNTDFFEVANSSSVTDVSIAATNLCRETTTIETLEIPMENTDEDLNSTAIENAALVIVIAPVGVVILMVILMILVAAGIYYTRKRKWIKIREACTSKDARI